MSCCMERERRKKERKKKKKKKKEEKNPRIIFIKTRSVTVRYKCDSIFDFPRDSINAKQKQIESQAKV